MTPDQRAIAIARNLVRSVPGANSLVAWLALGVVAIGLAARLIVAWQDLATLTVRVLPDDAFYYFLTADRISNGQGISFDGIAPSNGYHPLWLFMLVPLYLVPGRTLPLHLGLTLSAVLDVIAGGLVGLAARRLTGNKVAGLFGVTFYLLLPHNVLAGVDGVESSLAAMLHAAFLLVLVLAWRDPPERCHIWAMATGGLAGLLVLARLESAAVVIAGLVALALLRSGPLRWPAPAIVLGTAGLVVAPWFIWSTIVVGTPVPVSGEATTWLWRQHFHAWNPDASVADFVERSRTYTSDVIERAERLYLHSRATTLGILTALAGIAGHFVIVARGERRRETARQLLMVGVPLLAFLVVLFINSAYRWSVRDWYFAWGIPAVALVLAIAFAYVCEIAERAIRKVHRHSDTTGLAVYVGLVLIMGVLFFSHARETWQTGYHPIQGQNYRAAQFLRESTDANARAAAFNAGIIGYFSERTVINLDGVVNTDAYHAMREHRLLAYLRSAGVEYVADRDGAWTNLPAFIRPDDWTESLWGEDPNAAMTSILELPAPGTFPRMNVWRLLPEEEVEQ